MTMQYDVTQWLIYDPERIDPSLPTGLWFCADVLDVQAVGVNACCLPLAGEWDDLVHCHDFIAQFPYVLAAAGSGRDALVRELTRRLPYIPVLAVQPSAFRGYQSIRALREQCGERAVEHLLLGAVEQPSQGLLDISKVRRPDITGMTRSLSGIRELDSSIGGFYAGELSVWTGKRGEGKSTFLGQMLLEAETQGHKICAYSGELPDWRFREWTYLQAAGPGYVKGREDKDTGKMIYTVPEPVQDLIDEWMEGHFFLYDLKQGAAHDEDSILEIFEYAARRYGCGVFLVDNIMTARFKTARDADYYRAQSNFTGRLVEFAKKFNVHVHLVAHPKKTEGKRLEADDVSGTGEITNRADNVFSLKRLEAEEVEREGFGTLLSVLKNRSCGGNVKIKLDFEPTSRRFYKAFGGAPDRKYPWEFVEQRSIPEGAPESDPFKGRS